MSLWKKIFKKHHIGVEPAKYFEVKIPSSPRFLCSDKACPCPGKEQLIPGKTGFLFISKELVQLRATALTYREFMSKANRNAQGRGITVFLEQGVYEPLFMCEQAARKRGLDFAVAAADAAYVFKHGWCPLRPTPKQKSI